MHALPGLCALNIFEYEISLSCGKFRNHHREPLFGHGNTFNRGRPVYISFSKLLVHENYKERMCHQVDVQYLAVSHKGVMLVRREKSLPTDYLKVTAA